MLAKHTARYSHRLPEQPHDKRPCAAMKSMACLRMSASTMTNIWPSFETRFGHATDGVASESDAHAEYRRHFGLNLGCHELRRI
ncbi:hypothetical protein AWB76_07665 [Caballeronia temeraria]|uniref:Uncharacterized protein n=1 Tax=Caballeronia temeraria TaxID=1777137 RepID=A0A158DX27_9BURK|nr:hypothetical protein AWB76_07665 [Caballeronia temeraria]